jgi:hypothetical protein
MTTTMFEEILGAFTSPRIHVDDMPADSPEAVNARLCERLFTNGVDTLRALFPNLHVRKISRLIWDLIGSRQVATAVAGDIPSITFAVGRQNGVDSAIILVPYRWPDMVKEDWTMQLGAILNAGVQAVDFCNDRMNDRPAVLARCLAYEAELLRMIQTIQPTWKPNDYQKMVLSKYPEGIRSPGVELYEPRSTAPKGSA